MKIEHQLTQLVTTALQTLQLSSEGARWELSHPHQKNFGDFSCNVAMVLHKPLVQQQPEMAQSYPQPRALAEEIAAQITEQLSHQTKPIVDTVTVAGPGFINFTLSQTFLVAEMARLASQAQLVDPWVKQRKSVVEYSSPNIAKPFTIGHLRSTIIGSALANLLSTAGYQVFRDNHLGDWGTQFGKQIYAIKTWGNEAAIEQSPRPVKELVDLYVKFHQEAEAHPELEEEGRAWFKRLEDGDPEARRLWQKCIDWSWKEFQVIYQRLNVSFTENKGRGYGESFFEDKMSRVIAELKEQKLLTDSEGAQLIFFPEDEFPPLMILKKDGATLYATRDLATDYFRLQHYGDNVLIVNEVGAEQGLYFKQLFRVEEILGWYQPGQRVHVGHGLYRFKDQKMSTRKGNVIWLEDVLQEAFDRVKAEAKDRISDEDIWKVAIGALKWNDLKRSSQLDVVFDWDELLRLQGNSGPYLQYTYVRGKSIMDKAASQFGESFKSDITKYIDTLINNNTHIDHRYENDELLLLRSIYQYSEAVELAATEYAPHHLCTYLYNLAQTYNSFYATCSVVEQGSSQPTPVTLFRLALTQAVMRILQHGLGLLGIDTVAKM